MCYIIIKDDGDNMQKMKDKEMALSCIFRFDEKDNVCYAKINKNLKNFLAKVEISGNLI